MSEEQLMRMIEMIRNRMGEENLAVCRKSRSGDYSDLSYRAGKAAAFSEALFIIRGLFPEAFDNGKQD